MFIAARLARPAAESGRLDWIDNAKAILIYLIVLGHFAPLDPHIKSFLYSFHVPAFLILTGFMLPQALPGMSMGQCARKYLIPYAKLTIFFTLLSVPVGMLRDHVKGDDRHSLWEILLNGLYGSQSEGHMFLHGNAPLWYLPFLTTSLLIFLLAIRMPRMIGILFMAGYAAFSLFYHGPRWPWALDAAGLGALFIAVGWWVRDYTRRADVRRQDRAVVAGSDNVRVMLMAAALLAVTLFLSWINGKPNMNYMLFGDYPLLFVLAALTGTAGVALVALLLPPTRLAQLLSVNTLVIFATHIFVVRELGRAMGRVPEPFLQGAILIAAAIVTLVFAYISKLMMPWIDRFVLGRKPIRQEQARAAV